jgi:hypothetical protein
MSSTPPLLRIAEGKRALPRQAPTVHPSELAVHIGIIRALQRNLKPKWDFWHTPNGEHRDPRTAAKFKAMGVKPGIPDLLLLSPTDRLHCLEIKAHAGRLSEEQETFRQDRLAAGTPYVIARSIDEALAALDGWGALITKHHGGAR